MLAGAATAATVGTAGCSSPDKTELQLQSKSDYFDSVEYKPVPQILGVDEIQFIINLRRDAPKDVTAILLFIDGQQEDLTTVATGETAATIHSYYSKNRFLHADTLGIAAVSGGEERYGVWVGGDILEQRQIVIPGGGETDE